MKTSILKWPLILMLVYGTFSQKKEGITITPPPTPQEVLPPKPIIVMPLMVRQHAKKSKFAIIRTGRGYPNGMSSPFQSNFSNLPPVYPFPGARSLQPGMIPPQFPNFYPSYYNNQPDYSNITIDLPATRRKLSLGQQINVKSISQYIPELADSIRRPGELKESESEDKIKADLAKRSFESMHNKIESVMSKIEEVNQNIEKMHSNLEEGYENMSGKLSKVEELKNKARKLGLM